MAVAVMGLSSALRCPRPSMVESPGSRCAARPAGREGPETALYGPLRAVCVDSRPWVIWGENRGSALYEQVFSPFGVKSAVWLGFEPVGRQPAQCSNIFFSVT